MTEETKDLIEKDLVDPIVTEIVESLLKLKDGSKKQRFHMYRMFNLPIKTCAKLSGYKPGYGYQLVREYKHDPNAREIVGKLISDMPE